LKLGAPRGLLLQVCQGASRKVSTVPQLDDDTLPQQWHSNRSVRSLFHDGSYWRVLTVRIASLEVRKGRLHLSGRHRRMTLFALTGRLESTTYCGHSRPLPRTPQLGENRTCRHLPHARNDPGPDSAHVVRVAGKRTGEHAFLDQGATDH